MRDLVGSWKSDAPAVEPAEQKEMYPTEVALRSVFTDRASEVADVLGLDATQRAARESAFTEVIRSTGLDPLTVGEPLYRRFTDAEIADRRGADAPDVQALDEESRRLLREAYGAEDAENLLARTRAFVAQHPKLAATLRTRGLGSQPEVVRLLVEHVRATNFRGTSKKSLMGV
jgi:hypothetical protein